MTDILENVKTLLSLKLVGDKNHLQEHVYVAAETEKCCCAVSG